MHYVTENQRITNAYHDMLHRGSPRGKAALNESIRGGRAVNEGAGAGYTIEIDDIALGEVTNVVRDGYDWKFDAAIVPGDYEVRAYDYYNTVLEGAYLHIDGGKLSCVTDTFAMGEDEADLRREVANTRLSLSLDYGYGWVHVDLPEDGLFTSDYVKVRNTDYVNFEVLAAEVDSKDITGEVNYSFSTDNDEGEGSFGEADTSEYEREERSGAMHFPWENPLEGDAAPETVGESVKVRPEIRVVRVSLNPYGEEVDQELVETRSFDSAKEANDHLAKFYAPTEINDDWCSTEMRQTADGYDYYNIITYDFTYDPDDAGLDVEESVGDIDAVSRKRVGKRSRCR